MANNCGHPQEQSNRYGCIACHYRREAFLELAEWHEERQREAESKKLRLNKLNARRNADVKYGGQLAHQDSAAECRKRAGET